MIIEDNAGDALLLEKAMKDPEFDISVHVLADSTEVMTYLQERGAQVPVQNPDLIFLDLSLPKISGLEVLKQIKINPQTKSIPVVVVTGSGSPDDIRIAHELGSAGYVEKTARFEDLKKGLQSLKETYFELAKLPTKR